MRMRWIASIAMLIGLAGTAPAQILPDLVLVNAPHLYLGLAARIVFGRQVITKEQGERIQVDPQYVTDCSEPVLFTSRGGTRYERTFLQALIRNGVGPEDLRISQLEQGR